MGGVDADCHGLLIGWNGTSGGVGDWTSGKNLKMTDCAFVANKGELGVPTRTPSSLGLPAPLTADAATRRAADQGDSRHYQGDAVKISWAGASEGAVGFRVDRRIAGKWQVIAYRPPRPQGDEDNPQEWIDFTAPSGKELTYRVVAIDADDATERQQAHAGSHGFWIAAREALMAG